MEILIRQLQAKQHITIREFHKLLIDQISAEELDGLQSMNDRFIISAYNRNTILRMANVNNLSEGLISCKKIISLTKLLQAYLDLYMKEQPSGHKWIILCCLFLTFIVKEPMHPQEIVHWVKAEDNGTYYCPEHSSGEGSVCCYCVCKSNLDL